MQSPPPLTVIDFDTEEGNSTDTFIIPRSDPKIETLDTLHLPVETVQAMPRSFPSRRPGSTRGGAKQVAKKGDAGQSTKKGYPYAHGRDWRPRGSKATDSKRPVADDDDTEASVSKRPKADDFVPTLEIDDQGKSFIPLAPNTLRRVTVNEYRGQTMIDIRECYADADEEVKPGKRGISLNIDQYNALLQGLPLLEPVLRQKGLTVHRPAFSDGAGGASAVDQKMEQHPKKEGKREPKNEKVSEDEVSEQAYDSDEVEEEGPEYNDEEEASDEE